MPLLGLSDSHRRACTTQGARNCPLRLYVTLLAGHLSQTQLVRCALRLPCDRISITNDLESSFSAALLCYADGGRFVKKKANGSCN